METLAIVLLLAVTLALLLPIAFFFYISAVLALMVGWSFGRPWGWGVFAVTLSLAVYAVAMKGDTFPAVGWILVAAPFVLWRPIVGHGRRKRAAERAALIERMRAQKKAPAAPFGAARAMVGDGFTSAVRYVNLRRSGR